MNTPVIPVAHKDEIYYALLDVDDFWPALDRAYQVGNRWRLATNGYVVLAENGKTVLLHRFLMGREPGDGLFVDHINRDRLDNRRRNLRVLTPSQSPQNLSVRSNSLTGYRGVMVLESKKNTRRYQARVMVNGKIHHLGTYDTPEQAAAAAADGRARLAPFSQEACLAQL